MIISAAAFGLIVGALLGLVGGGGSILAVPALVYGVGLPLAAAIPTSLVVVGASSAVAVLPRLRTGVNWRLALIIGAAGTATAYLGAVVNRLLDPKILLLAFAAIMVFAGVRMLMPSTSSGGACALPGGGINWRSCLPKAIATGAVVGFLTGLLGVGGGFLIVPALTLILGLPMALTVGTSLVIIVINSAAGFAAHLGDLQIDWAVTAAFAGAAMVASLAAGRIGTRIPDKALKRGFAILVLVNACARVPGELTYRPNSFAKKPLPVDFSCSCPRQRWEAGTPRMTWSTCWPQPAHVVLPHFLHVTARHICLLP